MLDDWKPNYSAQPYAMFFTYGFLHGGLAHLGVNMVTLWSLGRAVLDRVGAGGFALLYGGSILGGAAGFALLAPDLRPMVGASGALFGLAGGILAWLYVDRYTYREGLWPVIRAVLLLAALNVVLWWAMDGQLAWQTHLGGFVAGWVLALLIDPRPEPPAAPG
ncbi:rhomboid family intramembrane serine protease [Rhodovulum sp. ES.010]|uniref:rhomboid family intramembrane serine protease n=1 Tax=Rhodovulum sp. ES.010 TaxID=1882821 RepID=UPI000B02A96D|nr:rhomboid family intramembrane serine protease [Rhodovulum sp. ES.010]